MKNNYLYNWVVIVFMMLQMLAFTSCSDDDDNSGWPTETDKTEIFIERFSTLVTNLTALRDGATYGELKDNYPVSSKAMLDDEIVYLEETIAKLKEGNKKLADSEADRIIRVLPHFQGAHCGSFLFREAVRYIKEVHPEPCLMELNVNRNNKALLFYERMGMRKLREGDFPIGNGYYMNDYIMGLDI